MSLGRKPLYFRRQVDWTLAADASFSAILLLVRDSRIDQLIAVEIRKSRELRLSNLPTFFTTISYRSCVHKFTRFGLSLAFSTNSVNHPTDRDCAAA